jgi:hypothetical protein
MTRGTVECGMWEVAAGLRLREFAWATPLRPPTISKIWLVAAAKQPRFFVTTF